MPRGSQYEGISSDDIKNKQNQGETPQEQQPTQQNQPEPQPQEQQLDDKDINILQNTFGIDPNNVPDDYRDKVVNVAKSYREAQGKWTKEQEQRQMLQQTLENFEKRLQQYPEVWDTVEKVARGEYNSGNSAPEPKGKPTQQSQPATADEQTLIKEGYLTANELDGLDDLSRSRAVARAEIQYSRDKALEDVERQMRERFDKVTSERTEQERQEYVEATNKKRFQDSFDKFVSEYAVNFTELDESVINSIRQRANVIRDPQDPSLLDADAFYDAAVKELAIRNKLPQQQAPAPTKSGGVNEILDTGHSANRRSSPTRENTVDDIMDQHTMDRWKAIEQRTKRFARK